VPFSVPDDGKVATTRVAVVNLQVPGLTPAPRAELDVNNNDSPIITVNGEADDTIIQLDPWGDNSDLTTISLNDNAETGDGETITSTTLQWAGSQFTMWLSDQVGQPGTDLGSLPGVYHDPYNGTESYTWTGSSYPKTIYGQDLSPSDPDGTVVGLYVDVAEAATFAVSANTAEAAKSSEDTAPGKFVIACTVQAPPLPPVVGAKTEPQVIVGEQISAFEVWDGPNGTNPTDNVDPTKITYAWTYDGTVTEGLTPVAGTDQNGKPAADGKSTLFPLDTKSQDFVFAWVSGSFAGKEQSVTCTLTVNGKPYPATGFMNVMRPDYTINTQTNPWSGAPKGQGRTLELGNPNAQGITFTTAGQGVPAGFTGQVQWVQVIDNVTATAKNEGAKPIVVHGTKYPDLDKSFPYDSFNNAGEPVDSPDIEDDAPSVASLSYDGMFRMFLLWEPTKLNAGIPAMYVPLQVVSWNANGKYAPIDKIWKATGTVSKNPKGTDTTDYPKWNIVDLGN
jgi:hypothetical protein